MPQLTTMYGSAPDAGGFSLGEGESCGYFRERSRTFIRTTPRALLFLALHASKASRIAFSAAFLSKARVPALIQKPTLDISTLAPSRSVMHIRPRQVCRRRRFQQNQGGGILRRGFRASMASHANSLFAATHPEKSCFTL